MSPVAVEVPGSLSCVGADFKLISAGEGNGSSGRSRHVTAGAQSWKIGLVVVVICSDITFHNTVKQFFSKPTGMCYSLFLPLWYFLKEALSKNLYKTWIFIVVVGSDLQAPLTD